MVFKLDESLEGLLKRIEVNERDRGAKLSVTVEKRYLVQMAESVDQLDHDMWLEFRERYPDEFTITKKDIGKHGVLLAGLVEKAEDVLGLHPEVVQVLRSQLSIRNAEQLAEYYWARKIGSVLTSIIHSYVFLSSSRRNRISVTGLYGSRGVVYLVNNGQSRFSLRQAISDYLQKRTNNEIAAEPDEMHKTPLDRMHETDLVIACNLRGNEAYAMHSLKNVPATPQ